MIPVRALLADLASAIDQGNGVRALEFRLTAAGYGLRSDPKLTDAQQLWFWRGQLSVLPHKE